MLRSVRQKRITEEKVLPLLAVGFNLLGMYAGQKMEWYIISEERMRAYFCFQQVVGMRGGYLLWLYIACRRIVFFLLLFLLPTMKGGRKLRSFLLLEWSGLLGCITANMIRIFGLRGVVLLVLAMFPQWFFYGMAVKEMWGIFRSSIPFQESYGIIKENRGLHNFLPVAFWEIMGIVSECWINPCLMEWMFIE